MGKATLHLASRYKARDLARQACVADPSPEALQAREDFAYFCEYVTREWPEPATPAAHHLEWHQHLVTGKDSKCLIKIAGQNVDLLAPRGSAKSTVSGLYVAWVIGIHTQAKMPLQILYISFALSAARAKSAAIKQIIQSAEYREIFPSVQKGRRWSDEYWGIDRAFAGINTVGQEDFTMICAGASGTITSKRCFVGSTLVETEMGRVPIESLEDKVGTQVLSFNHQSQQLEWKQIQAFGKRLASSLVEVTTDSGNKLRCTPDHPIYIEGQGYKDAERLEVGEKVITLQGQSWEHDTIASVKAISGDEWVYDIQVEHNHNLFAEGILAHNCHLVVLDDLLKSPDQVESVDVREKIARNWSSVIRPTMLEGGRAIALATRMRADDVHESTFIPEKGWVQIEQQAILTDEETGEERSYWPSMWSLNYLKEQRTADPVAFQFQYQNKVQRVGDISLDPSWIRYGDIPLDFDALAVGVDLASSLKEKADYTVFVLAGRANGKYYILDYRRGKWVGNMEKIDVLLELYEEWAEPDIPFSVYVESIAYQASFKGDWVSYAQQQRGIHDIHCYPVIRKGDKLQNLRGVTGLFQNGLVWFNQFRELAPITYELTNFGSAKNDDCVDGTQLALKGLASRSRIEAA